MLQSNKINAGTPYRSKKDPKRNLLLSNMELYKARVLNVFSRKENPQQCTLAL
jgi:hypothetical protein